MVGRQRCNRVIGMVVQILWSEPDDVSDLDGASQEMVEQASLWCNIRKELGVPCCIVGFGTVGRQIKV